MALVRPVTAAGLLVTAALLGACAAPPGPPPPPAPTTLAGLPRFGDTDTLTRAVRLAVNRAGSASTTLTVDEQQPGRPPARLVADGQVVFTATGGWSVHSSTVVDFDNGTPPALLELVGLPGGVLYARPPAEMTPYLGAAPAPGRPWTGPFPAEGGSGAVASLRSVAAYGRDLVDPANGFATEYYGDASTVVAAQDDVIDGVALTRYVVRTDLARAEATQTDPYAQDRIRSDRDAGSTSRDVTIWVDANGLPRRYSQIDVSRNGTRSFTVDYRAWEQPVTVSPPAPDRISPV